MIQLCGMANALSIGSEPGHILIGIEQAEEDRTGRIVGVDPSILLNEADYRQKVATYLNRGPDFSLYLVSVDGMTVGVFEVRPGPRPYYAIKESPPLRKPLAYLRDGESVEPATPVQIIEWAREDGRLLGDEAALRARMAIILNTRRGAVTIVDEGAHAIVTIHLENLGEHAFYVKGAAADWSYTSRMHQEVTAEVITAEAGTAKVDLSTPRSAPGPMGNFAVLNVWVPLPMTIGRRYKARQLTGLPVATLDVTVTCANAAGAEKTESVSFTIP